jgi:hypothetical protein
LQATDVFASAGAAVAAISGSAQPMWVDTRDVQGQKQEILSARLDDPGYYH